MHYDSHDLERLIRPVPLMRFLRLQGASRFLSIAVKDAEELTPILRQYPGLRYQPLEFHYVCLQSLGALNHALVRDLTDYYGWHGLVWASFLAALAPSATYRSTLESSRIRQPRQAWAVDVALVQMGAPCPTELKEITGYVNHLRELLSVCPLPEVSLRRAESPATIASLRQVVLAAYKQGGADVAFQALHSERRVMQGVR
jgi:hypothetical protein